LVHFHHNHHHVLDAAGHLHHHVDDADDHVDQLHHSPDHLHVRAVVGNNGPCVVPGDLVHDPARAGVSDEHVSVDDELHDVEHEWHRDDDHHVHDDHLYDHIDDP